MVLSILFSMSIVLFVCCSIGMGWIIAKRYFKQPIKQLVAALTLSIPLWSLQGYVLGYAHLRNISYFIALVSLVVFLKSRMEIRNAFIVGIQTITKNKLVFLFILVSLSIQLLGIVGSGLPDNDGNRTYHRLQSSDGLFHVAFAQSMVKDFPPMQPGAAGLPITNYHYWSNLYIAEISRIFQVPVDTLFFQMTPIMIGMLLVSNMLLLADSLRLNKASVVWMLFFHFWAGNSLIFLSKLFKDAWDFTMPAIDHGMIQFYNPPQTFAKVLLIFISWWWLTYLSKRKKSTLEIGILASVAASLFGYKIYFGLYAYLFLAIWLFFSFISVIRKKGIGLSSWLATCGWVAVGALIALAIYLPPNKQAGGLFLAPLAWPKILLGQNNLNWNEWWLRMQVYEEANSWKGMSAIYFSAIIITLIGIAGTRLLGLVSLYRVFATHAARLWWIIHLIASITFFFVGMNFLQVSGGANTFNFFILSLIVWGWFAGIVMGKIISQKNRVIYLLFSIVIVLVSIPRPLQEVWLWRKSYFENIGSFELKRTEHDALLALKNLPDGIFISSPIDKHDFFETPYRSFFSQKKSYLSGLGILNSHNQPVADREQFALQLFNAASSKDFGQLLASKNISYAFLSPEAENSLFFQLTEDQSLHIAYKANGYKIVSRL